MPDLPVDQNAGAPSAEEVAVPTVDRPESDAIWAPVLEPDSDADQAQTPQPNRLVRWWQMASSTLEWGFGLISLLVGLALLATIPVLQFLSLGYLLEVSARVADSGRWRDGFAGVRKAARLGGMFLGTWLWMLPVRFVSSMWYTAALIDPGSAVTRNWRIALYVTTVLVLGHIMWAWYRGGRMRHFLWPAPVRFARWLFQRRKYAAARDATWDFVVSLRLPHYFWLGFRGFCGAMVWLFLPILLFIGATTLRPGPAVLAGLVGSLSLALVILHLPFLQTRFAMTRRIRAMFQLGPVYRGFFTAPVVYWLALFTTLLFALPLYLLKIELTPREVALLPSLVFVAFMWPARIVTGWAVHRGNRHRRPRVRFLHALVCVSSMLAAVPVVGFYVLVVFLTRYTSWYGVWSLFEQHAFLVPVPFLGM